MKAGGPTESAERLLEKGDIKPTANRLLVLRCLADSPVPLSLIEIETAIGTMERSSVLRVLNLLLDRDVVHTFEDGRGVSKYEICHGASHCSPADMHAHFYCERCEKVYCFEDITAPRINIPSDFRVRTVNYMLKGICPECGRSH